MLMRHSELISILDFIRFATTQFENSTLYYGHGTDNAWDEACALILGLLKIPPSLEEKIVHCRLTSSEKNELFHNIEQRIFKRIPVPYLIHEAWFAGLKFRINSNVIIPRSPIAELILNRFDLPQMENLPLHQILDLCTGSGCIAIATALHFPNASVDAIDIDKKALACAQENVEAYHLNERVHLIKSDLFNNLTSLKYDLILSNPPYVDHKEMESLPKEYRREPRLALEAGQDGLKFAKRILKEASNHLHPHGILILEVGASQNALQAAYPHIPFLWLEFEQGGEGVLLMTKSQLEKYRNFFEE